MVTHHIYELDLSLFSYKTNKHKTLQVQVHYRESCVPIQFINIFNKISKSERVF